MSIERGNPAVKDPSFQNLREKSEAISKVSVQSRLIHPEKKASEPSSYLEEIYRYPALTVAQEHELFVALRSGEDIGTLKQRTSFTEDRLDERYTYALQQCETLEELAFRCNARWVISEARRYPGLPQDDLIQEGNLGLWKAIEKYDPELGRLKPYARWWIRGAMFAAMPDLIRPIHIPQGLLKRINRLKKLESELQQSLGRKPSEEELRNEVYRSTNFSDTVIDTIFEIRQSGILYTTSLDTPLVIDEEFTLYDVTKDKDADVEAEVFNNDSQTDALISAKNDELRSRRRPSAREVAETIGKSRVTAGRALAKLVQAGLLPLHPRDSRTVDGSGFTEHTRRLDSLVEAALKEDPKRRNKEIAMLLSHPDMLGILVRPLTIERSRLRLAATGKIERKIMDAGFYRNLDDQVEQLLDKGLSDKQMAEELKQPIKRIKSAAYRLRKAGRADSRIVSLGTREKVQQYLEEYRGKKINLSEIARQIGVSRERVRQVFKEL